MIVKRIKKLKSLSQEKSLKNEVIEKQKQVEEYKKNLIRLQADFENYIKRSEKEKKLLKEIANHELILKILPIIDNFEKAVNEIKKINTPYFEGIELIYKQLLKILEEEGVKPIVALGEKVDPYKHEVIKQLGNNSDKSVITEEIQKGYMFNNKVLRHSKVIITDSKKTEVKNNFGGN